MIGNYEAYELYRDKKGLNNYQVATLARIPLSTLYDWKAGRYVPKTDKLAAVAKVLEISIEAPLTEKEEA